MDINDVFGGVILILVISIIYWIKYIKDVKKMKRFELGDYVCTMYMGQYVYGSIQEYYKKQYYILLDDGRKIKISESTWCVKSNPLKY